MLYTLQVGDECIVAPLSLFHTELLSVTGTGKTVKVQKPAAHQSDAEDCFDAEYIRETGVRMVCRVIGFFYVYFLCKTNFREEVPKNNLIKINAKVA